jgi:hypothetical protein
VVVGNGAAFSTEHTAAQGHVHGSMPHHEYPHAHLNQHGNYYEPVPTDNGGVSSVVVDDNEFCHGGHHPHQPVNGQEYNINGLIQVKFLRF